MQLLVSVRDSREVLAALEGGADIIDAKEPAGGALGAVAPDRLRQIDERVPDHVRLSVALGEFCTPRAAAAAVSALPLRCRPTRVYVKLAVAGIGPDDVARLLTAAVEAAALHPAAPDLVAVEYADRSLDVRASDGIRVAAALAGVHGLLLDTVTKDGRTLLDWWPEERLYTWIRNAHTAGLLAAVAGSLGVAEVARVRALEADVIGVRGAACAGGRSGTVEASRVALLRRALAGELVANRKTPDPNPAPTPILK